MPQLISDNAEKYTPPDADRGYDSFRDVIQRRFRRNLERGNNRLFTTNATGLFETYLDGFAARDRQYHTCDACRRFFERYAGLKIIDNAGASWPAIWSIDDYAEIPAYYRASFRRVLAAAQAGSVNGVFYATELTWGQPQTKDWTHLAVYAPAGFAWTRPLLSAEQGMAEKLEDKKALEYALSGYSKQEVANAIHMLKSERLIRAEHLLGPIEWLLDLMTKLENHPSQSHNILWSAVAGAPGNFCKPRGTMVGNLIEEVRSGKTIDQIAAAFNIKMDGLNYQRPKAAPSEGAVVAAEKIFDQLGLAPALRRRFAKLEEIEAVWRPRPSRPVATASGLFAHIKVKDARVSPLPANTNPITMTWDKFSRTVLLEALEIEFFAAPRRMGYTSLVTAADMSAPPIIRWDSPGRRNPFSWYLWKGGSLPNEYGLFPNRYYRVNAITLKPSMWHEPEKFANHGKGVIFVIDGASDSQASGLALFPEILRSELHQVRSVIEAHSNSDVIEGRESASAAGIMLNQVASLGVAQSWDARFRVTTSSGIQDYILDRWD